MLVLGFPAGSFGTNCYVLAAGPDGPCVVVDPGQDATASVRAALGQRGLRLEAVLLTRGHVDHTWSVAPLCEEFGVPVYIHPLDREMPVRPEAGLPADFPAAVLRGFPRSEPELVRPLPDEGPLGLAGLHIGVHHAPGHTPGSVAYSLRAGEDALLLTGDSLLAYGPGRAFPPVGDPDALAGSMSGVCGPRRDRTAVLPGHGGTTTVGAVRRFLQALSSKCLPRLPLGGAPRPATPGTVPRRVVGLRGFLFRQSGDAPFQKVPQLLLLIGRQGV
ncbi:MBL fold metallo-hydrolase [Streptomyces sp. NPDC001549]|uniref:MBL fold metallo-hydrolase n=1 Tax=Streptomyces sp. NPDC001549 TaxID=3364586 RepID=UPI00368CE4E7